MNPCDLGRERVHAYFDGDASEPDAGLREHLAICAGCRELFDDLTRLRGMFRELPRPSLPPETLEAVWSATVRQPRRATLPRAWSTVAAAAVLGIASLTTVWLFRLPFPSGPSGAELARAEAQADIVFGVTARALAATRTAAEGRVLASKVSPAVRGDRAAALAESPSPRSERR